MGAFRDHPTGPERTVRTGPFFFFFFLTAWDKGSGPFAEGGDDKWKRMNKNGARDWIGQRCSSVIQLPEVSAMWDAGKGVAGFFDAVGKG